MINNIEEILLLWQVNNNESTSLTHNKIIKSLEAIVPSIPAQEQLNCLRLDNWVVVNVRGEYILTAKGVARRLLLPDYIIEKPVAPRTHMEWARFRKILSYYIDCVHAQEKSQHYFSESDLNKKFFVPILPVNWLKDLGQESVVTITVPRVSSGVLNSLVAKAEDEENIYIGYPVSAFVSNGSTKACYSPIGLVPVDIIDHSTTTLTLKLRLDEAEINQDWFEFNIAKHLQNETITTILKIHQNDSFSGMIDLLKALPFLQTNDVNFDPNDLSTILPKFTKDFKREKCNTPMIFIGKSLLYAKILKKELKHIRDNVPDEVLDTTSLAYLFREPLLEHKETENRYMPLEFIASNQEQIQAVDSALNQPISKITGPPGTGKSQVAVNIIANMEFNGKKVLFTSKNHKAVLAIAERSQSIMGDFGLSLVNFCTNEDSSTNNAWYTQDLDLVTAKNYTIMSELDQGAYNTVSKAIRYWHDVQKRYRKRNEAKEQYSRVRAEYEKYENELKKHYPVSTPDSYSPQVVAELSKRLNQLSEPQNFKFYQIIRLLKWHIWGKRKAQEAEAFISKNYNLIQEMAVDMSALKRELNEFISLYELYSKTKEQLLVNQENSSKYNIKAKDFKIFKRSLDDINKNIQQALVFNRCKNIAELEQDEEIKGRLKGIMAFLKSAKSPYFFQKINAELYKEAQEGFTLFAKYYPCWATTLLSLTKAAPCLPNLFDSVVIDEAAQCDLASIIPALFRSKSATLIGDPNQFPPVISLRSQRNDYFKSKNGIIDIEEQRYDYMHCTAFDVALSTPVLLREHFRCADDIAEYFNDEFYANQLKVRTDNTKLKFPSFLGYKRAIEWIDINNEQESEYDIVKTLLAKLIKNNYLGSIGVITPFKSVAEELRTKLHDTIKSCTDILVNTVNAFQGGERDLIIFVIGYSHNLPQGKKWYIESSENRYIYNVAISRAKACLILVGDRTLCANSNVTVLKKLSELPRPPKTDTNKPRFASKWEEILYLKLKEVGIETEPQYPLAGRRLDLAIISGDIKIDIEVDGKAWHLNSDGERKTDDVYRDLQVSSQGWIVLRFWVHELNDDMDGCIARIKEEISTVI